MIPVLNKPIDTMDSEAARMAEHHIIRAHPQVVIARIRWACGQYTLVCANWPGREGSLIEFSDIGSVRIACGMPERKPAVREGA